VIAVPQLKPISVFWLAFVPENESPAFVPPTVFCCASDDKPPLGRLVKLAPDTAGKVAGNLASGIVPLVILLPSIEVPFEVTLLPM